MSTAIVFVAYWLLVGGGCALYRSSRDPAPERWVTLVLLVGGPVWIVLPTVAAIGEGLWALAKLCRYELLRFLRA